MMPWSPWLGQQMQFDRLKRREFITLLGGAAATWPLAASAQQAERMRRVGVLTGGLDKPNSGKGYPILLAELRKLGFIEGQNSSLSIGVPTKERLIPLPAPTS